VKDQTSATGRFQAVLDEYQKISAEFSPAISKATTTEERNRVFREKYPDPAKYAERFWAVAHAAPDDPAAVDALVWCVRLGFNSPAGARAVDRLADRHLDDPKLGALTEELSMRYGPKAGALLRAIAEKNPDRGTRGRGLFALGLWLNRRVELVRTLREDPKRAAQLTATLEAMGVESEALAKTDPDVSSKEAESAFERVVKEFGDVSRGRDSLAQAARAELHAIRDLAVGQPCPEIAGEDLDGKPFKLSDYKGKVVVVDFWGDW
jgi:hypothetical protein